MGKAFAGVSFFVSRLVKAVMVALLLPLAISLFTGFMAELEVETAAGGTFREWAQLGFFVYLGAHLLLYRPVALFGVSRRMFSAIAVWLFGGQVASVEAGAASRGKSGKPPKGEGGATTQGSTLVAFSPYVVPLYTLLSCLIGWLLQRGAHWSVADGPVSFMIGATMAFHWLMTADDLQQQRARWTIETYLLSVSLVFVVTACLVASCLPLAVPGFSFLRGLGEGLTRAQDIYTASLQRLFF